VTGEERQQLRAAVNRAQHERYAREERVWQEVERDHGFRPPRRRSGRPRTNGNARRGPAKVVEMASEHHGTCRGYVTNKCRCELCRAWMSDYKREWRAKRREQGLPER